MQNQQNRRDSLISASSCVTASSSSIGGSSFPFLPDIKTNAEIDMDLNSRNSKADSNTRRKREDMIPSVIDYIRFEKRNELRKTSNSIEEHDEETVIECETVQRENGVFEMIETGETVDNSKTDETTSKDEYLVKMIKLNKDIEKHKKCLKRMFVSVFIIQLGMVSVIFVVGKTTSSNKDNNFLDPYFEEVLMERMISSQDFRTTINHTIFCVTCRYNYDAESFWYRNEKGECCFRDIASVLGALKEVMTRKTDNLKDRVQELEVLGDNLKVVAKAANSSDHITVVQKTASSVSNELLQELFSRKRSAIHLKDSGEYKKVGHDYHVLWSYVDTTKRNLEVLDNGSIVSISTEGFYFLYCKILLFRYRTDNDTLLSLDPLTYQIRRKRHGTAFLLQETRQKWEQVGETMEFQSSAHIVYKLEAGDKIYVSFPGNQIQYFNQSSYGSHTLGLFEL